MTVHHLPAKGEGWGEIEEIIVKGALPEYAEVPLVIYNGNERHVIGTATVEGGVVSTMIDQPLAEEVMELLIKRPMDFHFTLDVSRGPNPFGKPTFEKPRKYEF